MDDLKARLIEDRFLRDSAKALMQADLQHVKNDLAHKSVGERATDRVKHGAMDIYEEAIEVAGDNKGALTALMAAVVIWFARNPILGLLGFDADTDEVDEEDDDLAEHEPFYRRFFHERQF